jgi:hypothetical protein
MRLAAAELVGTGDAIDVPLASLRGRTPYVRAQR